MATSPAVHCISYLVFRDAAQGTGGAAVYNFHKEFLVLSITFSYYNDD